MAPMIVSKHLKFDINDTNDLQYGTNACLHEYPFRHFQSKKG